MTNVSSPDEEVEEVTAQCPRCKRNGETTLARGHEEVEEIFGFRRVPAGRKDPGNTKTIPQSYCRTCRSEMSKIARQKKKAEDEGA